MQSKNNKNKPYIVGLYGGIGVGKTEATVILERLGAYIIDADVVSKELSRKGEACYNALKKEFPAFFDVEGNLDRFKLKEHIFSNNLSEKLNQIMFPIIISEIERRIITSNQRIIFLVAPLLIESNMHKMCDKLILVAADKQKRIERIMARDNINNYLATQIIASQATDDELSKVSNYIISNDGGIDDLYINVKSVYEKIKESVDKNI